MWSSKSNEINGSRAAIMSEFRLIMIYNDLVIYRHSIARTSDCERNSIKLTYSIYRNNICWVSSFFSFVHYFFCTSITITSLGHIYHKSSVENKINVTKIKCDLKLISQNKKKQLQYIIENCKMLSLEVSGIQSDIYNLLTLYWFVQFTLRNDTLEASVYTENRCFP